FTSAFSLFFPLSLLRLGQRQVLLHTRTLNSYAHRFLSYRQASHPDVGLPHANSSGFTDGQRLIVDESKPPVFPGGNSSKNQRVRCRGGLGCIKDRSGRSGRSASRQNHISHPVQVRGVQLRIDAVLHPIQNLGESVTVLCFDEQINLATSVFVLP